MALVITRNVNQALMIGNDVRIEVKEIGRGRVKLSIEAPRQVIIMREELLDQRGGSVRGEEDK